ncbi:DUF4064 domain-containing protein [Metabacillus sp. 84]|uniref:DUF4064 domain-containing protein n=1 Tax=Metabacillus sp. 84 TaxID=3404705 RepID=UPI003CEA0091
MSRVAELIFIIAGIVLNGLLLAGAFILYISTNNTEETRSLVEQLLQDESLAGAGLSADQIINGMSGGSLYITVVALICTVIGIVSIFLLKNKTKAAGILLIITGIVRSIASLFFGVFGGAAYLIAGIIALVRKNRTAAV